MTRQLTRRNLLWASVIGGAAITVTGCASKNSSRDDPAPDGEPEIATDPDAKTLLVYFSRAGENYYNGGRRDLDVGNTEVLAEMIRDRIDCDVYEIEAADPYPDSYDATVERNSTEQETDARPEIANPLPDVSQYDTVLIGSPVWGTRAPMIMSTFLDGVDLDGKTILPFVTYAVSGMSGIDDDYRDALPDAEVSTGLAVRGEKVEKSGSAVDDWLREAGLIDETS